MKDLVIIGASGFAMEVLWLAERCGRNVLGFLDDTQEKQNGIVLGYPILGEILSWPLYENCEFIIAIGSPRARKSVVSKMKTLGDPRYATLLDPSSIIGKQIKIKEGCIVCAGVICTTNIEVGQHSILNLSATIGHETVFGDFCTVAPGASISGNVKVGELVEIGTGAKIREKINIGSGSVVGMGSVLTKDVPENKVVVGNPARVIKTI